MQHPHQPFEAVHRASDRIYIFEVSIYIESLKVVSPSFLLVQKTELVKLEKKKKLFHFKSSFCFPENQNLEFKIYKFHDVNKEVNTVNEIWPVYVILQMKKIIKKLSKNCHLKTSSKLLYFCKELSTSFHDVNKEVNTVNEIWPVYVILQMKKIIKKLSKNCHLKTSSKLFCIFARN